MPACERVSVAKGTMDRQQKERAVEELAAAFGESAAVLAVDYRGIDVAALESLRSKLRAADARFHVAKNTLSKLAADRAGTEAIKEHLEGPTGFTFVSGDVAAAAKALDELTRPDEIIRFKGGLMGKDALTADDIRSIARLPSRDVLHGQLVGTVASPLTRLAGGLNQIVAGLAIALSQVAGQRASQESQESK